MKKIITVAGAFAVAAAATLVAVDPASIIEGAGAGVRWGWN